MIKKDYLVEKRNVLNELRANCMTLQELRFFSIYLAKINSRDVNTRVVRFSLGDFQKIMEFGKLNINQLKNSIDSLLCKVIGIPTERGGFSRFQLFKKCNFDLDNDSNWYIEIDAHDDALPLMFEFKERYFTYELWNALRLKSSNQLRMYEILKQYELKGERVISVDELKSLLGIEAKEYLRYDNLKTHVIDVCQKSLAENTDIKFTYEPTGKKGRGGKILNLKFTISKNTNHVDQLTIDDFVSIVPTQENALAQELDFGNKALEFYSDACNHEFNELELQVLYNLLIRIIPYCASQHNELEWFDYLKKKYDELNFQASRRKITKRFGYLKKIIEADLLD